MKTLLLTVFLILPGVANAAFICGAQGNSVREIEMCEYIIELEAEIEECAQPTPEVQAAMRRLARENRKLRSQGNKAKKIRS